MKKNKVGRPALKVKPKKIRTIYISDKAYAFYKKRGEGNFSEGVKTVFENIDKNKKAA